MELSLTDAIMRDFQFSILFLCKLAKCGLADYALSSAQPAEHLEDGFPEISSYLRSLSSTTNDGTSANIPNFPSEHAADTASDALAASLIASVRELAMSSDGSEQPSEEDIRRAVERVVLRGIDVGRDLGQAAASSAEPSVNNTDVKRRRTED
jgi:hypothetical protein